MLIWSDRAAVLVEVPVISIVLLQTPGRLHVHMTQLLSWSWIYTELFLTSTACVGINMRITSGSSSQWLLQPPPLHVYIQGGLSGSSTPLDNSGMQLQKGASNPRFISRVHGSRLQQLKNNLDPHTPHPIPYNHTHPSPHPLSPTWSGSSGKYPVCQKCNICIFAFIEIYGWLTRHIIKALCSAIATRVLGLQYNEHGCL